MQVKAQPRHRQDDLAVSENEHRAGQLKIILTDYRNRRTADVYVKDQVISCMVVQNIRNSVKDRNLQYRYLEKSSKNSRFRGQGVEMYCQISTWRWEIVPVPSLGSCLFPKLMVVIAGGSLEPILYRWIV
jgi:hypothetical protein